MIQKCLSNSCQESRIIHSSSYLKLNRRYKKILFKSLVSSLIILTICMPIGLNSMVSNEVLNDAFSGGLTNQFGTAQAGMSYSSSGDSRQYILQGVATNQTQGIVLLNPSSQESVSISAPQGWTSDALSGTIEHLSTQVGTLSNELLDDYHTERYIIPGSTWNSETYYVPDAWSIGKIGDSTPHPGHGGLYWYTSAGAGRAGSMGWRPSVLFDTTKTLNPSMEIYLTQQMQLPWREVYSCEVTFFHRVPTQTLNDVFYLFVRVGDYEAKFHIFETGYTTNTWLQTTVNIPMSVFANMQIPGAVSLDIGLSTDYSGLAPVNINNFVFIDEIKAVFEARPFPEQIDLTANNTIITGLTQGSVSPYVPDSASRDCYDHYSTGISTSQVRVGVYGSTSWTGAGKYQVGMQFPLNIPQGATVSSARLEIEAIGRLGGVVGVRIYVAQEDNVTQFTNGLPHLQDRYEWNGESIEWTLDPWNQDTRYRSPDISQLIQEVISRPGWSSGNYICLMLDYMYGTTYQNYVQIKDTASYNGDDLSRLFVDFAVPSAEDTISLLRFNKDIIIDHTKVNADLQDFPVLLDIYDTDLKTNARFDGADIRFMSGTEMLYHEIELFDPNYNSTHAHIRAWVRVPSLSASVDTVITMSYGAPDASSQENANQVWDGYESVWHLSEDTGSGMFLEDSSQNDHDGAPDQTTFMSSAQIGGARYFQDLAGNYIPFIDGSSIFDGWTDFQFSFWIYFDYSSDSEWTGVEPRIFGKGTSIDLVRTFRGSTGWPAGYATFQPDIRFNTVGTSYTGLYVKRQAWNYIVYKYESSGDGVLRAYSFADGALIDSGSDTGTIVGDRLLYDTNMFTLGIDGGSQVHRGGIDEFRTIKGYKSAAWIQTEYANQYDPSSFYSVGGEQPTESGSKVNLQFSSTAQSIVEILPRLELNATYQGSTLDDNFAPGTSFSVSNSTYATWTANVLVSPPSCVSLLNLTVDNPSIWTLTNVTDSLGRSRFSEVTSTGTQTLVSSPILDVWGIWTFEYSSTNEASALDCGVNAGAYGTTVSYQAGDLAKFRGTATVVPGSAMRLHLIDPNGQLFFGSDDTTQDGSGQFEWTGINVDSSWPNGLWEVQVDFNDTADSVPIRVGRYSRSFIVRHTSLLQLVSPTDAVGDGVSLRTAGDLLTVEVELTDTATAESMAGSAVTMNWTVSGMETVIQLEDYGTGTYGKTVNTSDLGLPGNWRINIQSSHPYLVDSQTYFDLELSHATTLVYTTPSETPYGNDFSVLVTLKDRITGDRYSGASFSSNGTITGTTDYNNGSYLIRIDSTGLSTGTYAFEIHAIPSQEYILDSSVQVVFRYRDVKTDLVQVGVSPVSVPWGQDAYITLEWQDIDNGGNGIVGGVVSGDGVILQADNLDGTYSLTIDVDNYEVGVYLFNLTISSLHYQAGYITVTVTIIPHRTLVTVTSQSSVPIGANTTMALTLRDLDLGNTIISSNVSSVLVEWTGGYAIYGTLGFIVHTQNWTLGTHTVHITVFTIGSPRYYYYAETFVVLNIRQLGLSFTWDDIGVLPIGDDFEIVTHITVNDSASMYQGLPVESLVQSHFTIRAQNGTMYNIKSFNNLGSGTYLLTIDNSFFINGTYGIRIYLAFGPTENYANIQSPLIIFEYAAARSDLSSPDYPLMTISFSTDAAVTLEFVDIDRGQGIDTATIFAFGAEKLGQVWISSGRYRVVLNTSTWTIGRYTVNFTASALNYENQTISIDIVIRQVRTYATATVGVLEIPVGDSKSFYVDYRDMDHDVPIFTSNHNCNWTLIHYDIMWTGTRYQITIHTFDSDALGTYVLNFEFSVSKEYENASFTVSVVIRTISTELRFLAPVEDATSSSNISISVYYGDRDHSTGIVSFFVECTVWNTTNQLLFTWFNGTGAGIYQIRIDASQFGSLGIQHLIIYFTWTGTIQKYENKVLTADVEILGEETDLTLIESALPSPCLEYMVYTFLYSQTSTGIGITNDTNHVFVSIEFEDVSIDLSQVDIWEVDRIGNPGKYSIGFNNSILGRTGSFIMRVFINWSEGIFPYYTNRVDLIAVNILPRNALLTVIPPTSVAYGENVTFSFTYDDTTGGLSKPITYNPTLIMISMSVPDFSISYNAIDGLYTITFNTSQLGAPLGQRFFTLDVTWSGLPFYTNITGKSIAVTMTARQTSLTCPTPPATPYGDISAFTIVFLDVAGAAPRDVQEVILEVYDGIDQIPTSYLNIIAQGSGRYRVEVNTSYFSQPGMYNLLINASSNLFYYQEKQSTRILSINMRETLLTAEPIRDVPYNTSIVLILHYQDLDTLGPIGNSTQLMTMLQILNGSNWISTCLWRPSLESYLLTIETYNQPLVIGASYLLWLNFSSENKTPFYASQDILISFKLRERDTSLDLISAPLQTQFGDYANLTILYRDILSLSGISSGTISIFFGGTQLELTTDYLITETNEGEYRISINTSSLGIPGIRGVTITANWTGGSPYYHNCQRIVNVQVTWRKSSVELVASPQDTWYLGNVTFDFAFTDLTTGERVSITSSDVSVYNNGTILAAGQYTIVSMGLFFRVSINSTVLSMDLVDKLNVSIHVSWSGGAPYYLSDSVAVYVTTIERTGNIDLQQIEDTAFGSIMNLTLVYTDQRRGTPIEGAIILLDCVESPGLIEGDDYWITYGTGLESGIYRISVNTTSLGSLGIFTFDIDVLWNPSQAPYYRNITSLQPKGVVREVQTSLSSDIPTPSVVAFNEIISFIIDFEDTDHGIGIDGADAFINVRYQSTGFEPSSWSVVAIASGQYNITLNMTDSLSTGLQTLIISINMFPYQSTETQAVFGLRNRVAGLSADLAPTNYAGHLVYVTLYLSDYDAADAPLAGAALNLIWADSYTYVDLGDGRYNVTLRTTNLDFGSHIVTVQVNLLHYTISSLNIKINLLAVPSELIVVWAGQSGSNEIYWGDPLIIYASINDTLQNQTVSTAAITFDWEGGTGFFQPTGMTGNYSAILDTSLIGVADTVTVRIEGSSPNYINASYLVVFRLLPRPMLVVPEDSQYVYAVPWGGSADIVVYLEDSLDNTKISNAILVASWENASGLVLNEIPGRVGFYRLLLSAGAATYGSYEIEIDASKENYGNSSAIIILSVGEIEMVMWLDNNTAAYEYTSFYWSETVRIGVYVLAPILEPSDPFSTGLANLIVTWYSPELGRNGTLLNGTLIGGRGYYYYDFNTSEGIASVHTFRIRALPPSSDYTDAENSTSILVRNLAAAIISPGSPEFSWGWTGLVNITYFDVFHDRGVQAEEVSYTWAGGSGKAIYLESGQYGIPIDTSVLRPGTYTITIICQKPNYNDIQIRMSVHIAPVPTEVVLCVSEMYQIAGSLSNLRMPYGDVLNLSLIYNNTVISAGIPYADFSKTYHSGPGFLEEPLLLNDLGNGSYSFLFTTIPWNIGDRFTFHVQFMLENHTTGILTFDITIIEIPTRVNLVGPSAVSMNWGTNTTFWISYLDAWPSHFDEGIDDAVIIITNDSPEFATVEYLGPDPLRPGWYEFRITASRVSGVAGVIIAFNKTSYVSQTVTLSVSVSPSAEDIALQNTITYGSAFLIVVILGAVVWIRILRVPKIIRVISGQIRSLRKGRIPKPAKGVLSRRELVMGIYSDLYASTGIKRKAADMPSEPIIVDVPEIEELIIDLSILTGMTQEELDDFKFEIAKMKMSQQTSFVREVIAQELTRVATLQNKSVEQVLQEVIMERKKRIGSEVTTTRIEDYIPTSEEPAEEEPAKEVIEFEDRLREFELEEMASELRKRGIPKHEIDSFIAQSKELPKDVVQMLLQSFQPKKKAEPSKDETEYLTEAEIDGLRAELVKRKASEREIESIIEQARKLPKELALELFKEQEEPTKKRKEKDEPLSSAEFYALRDELEKRGVPDKEIESILETAKTAPKKMVKKYIQSIDNIPAPEVEEEVEFEDTLGEMEIDELRKQLEDRNLPPEEVDAILKQAKGLPSALVDDLLKSIDADKENEKD